MVGHPTPGSVTKAWGDAGLEVDVAGPTTRLVDPDGTVLELVEAAQVGIVGLVNGSIDVDRTRALYIEGLGFEAAGPETVRHPGNGFAVSFRPAEVHETPKVANELGIFRMAALSTDIGCVRLSERFIENDPALPEELLACQTLTEHHLDDVVREIPNVHDATTLVGLAGTVSCTAAVELGLASYDRDQIHHFRLTKEAVEDVYRTLATENREERLANPGMEEARVDVIVGGLSILAKVMRYFGFTECLVSEADILDGLVMSLTNES